LYSKECTNKFSIPYIRNSNGGYIFYFLVLDLVLKEQDLKQKYYKNVKITASRRKISKIDLTSMGYKFLIRYNLIENYIPQERASSHESDKLLKPHARALLRTL
jgi:hypothetical protein